MWPFNKKCSNFRTHDWVLLGVVASGDMTIGSGDDRVTHENSMQQVACQCSRCPAATANIWRWHNGMKKEGENPYWYGSALGGEDIKVTEPNGPDGETSFRDPIKYEPPIMD